MSHNSKYFNDVKNIEKKQQQLFDDSNVQKVFLALNQRKSLIF